MTIRNCPICGGDHFGFNKCPYIEKPCSVCGEPTILACSDCAIESGGTKTVHVCKRLECRDKHEKDNPQHPKMMAGSGSLGEGDAGLRAS
jgi:hypothetical protein